MNDAITGGLRASRSIFRWAIARLLAAVLTLAAPVAAHAVPMSGYNPARLADPAPGPFIEMSTFAADTVLPVMGIIDDSWRGTFTPRNRNKADLYWQAASGVAGNGWRVAAFNRGELFIDSNRDSIEFIYALKKKQDLPSNRTYQADIRMQGMVASGVEVSHGRRLDWVVPGLSAGATVRFMVPNYLQEGTMTGHLTPTGPRSYDYNLYLDYAYGDNILYRQEEPELGGGYGYSADLGLAYRRGGWRAEALFRDLVGELVWDSVPYTTAYAVTPTMTTTPDGYQDFTPSIQGRVGHKRLHQEIPFKTDLSLGYDWPAFSIGAAVVWVGDQPRSWLETAWRLQEKWRVSLAYNPDYAAFNCGIAAYGAAVGVTFSNPELRDSRALGFNLSYLHSW